MKSPIGTLFLAVCMLIGAMSCEKNDKLTRDISGDWKLRSFTVDGVETFGSIIKSSKISFEKDGDYEWTITFADGSNDITEGEYEIDADDDEIKFIDDDGQTTRLDIDLDGDDLELAGIYDGDRVVLKAKKD
jgi:Lipocalin-like domain